jgi:exodeoxyribonuclease V alpha subunit
MSKCVGTLFSQGSEYEGTIEVLRVIFSVEDDGYAVLKVQDQGSSETFTLVGPVVHLSVGDRAEVSGEWATHPKFGPQLRASGALPLDPSDRNGQIAYLTSLSHIGKARAEILVGEYGEGVLSAIDADPMGVLGGLPGIGAEQASAAAKSWHASRAIRDLHVQLAPHGLAYLATSIHSRFRERAMTVLREDPYRLIEVSGVGFVSADKIAMAIGTPRDSDRRAQAAAVHTLAGAEQQGHTFLPVGDLTRRTSTLLGLNPDPDVLVSAPGLVLDGERAYRDLTQASELAVAKELASRTALPPYLDYDPKEDDPEDELTAEQRAAVRLVFESRLSALTGGPGVGKTVCTKAIVTEARRANATIALCAPTGRAARRLEEATGHEARTIHRMLEWTPGRKPGFCPDHPLPADLVIVDEASMLDLRLMETLLRGLARSTHIVFVGDADQLPPIGAGKPFDDLITSEVVPTIRLTQIFRQAARSMITTAAHSINAGKAPRFDPEEGQDHDFFFLKRVNPERALDVIVEVVAEGGPKMFGVDPIRDIQVLAPMYKGAVGIDALNARLQERLNGNGKRAMRNRFRIGDRLIQTRNSHELGLMNGSIVFLRADDPDEEEILVDTDDGESLTIPYGETATLRLAYAISVHKAQGCEIPMVVAVCHGSHAHMLNRPLLYTAITRARNTCVVVGDPRVLRRAVEDDSGSRYSALNERLRTHATAISGTASIAKRGDAVSN